MMSVFVLMFLPRLYDILCWFRLLDCILFVSTKICTFEMGVWAKQPYRAWVIPLASNSHSASDPKVKLHLRHAGKGL